MPDPQALRVLHVIDGLGVGGAERMLVDLANRATRDGHHISVCVTRSTVTLARELDPSIELLVLDRKRRFSLSAVRRLSRFIRENRVDVLHVHMRSSLAFMLLLRMTRVVTTPIVFHDHYGAIETDTHVPPWFRIGQRFIDRYVGVYEQLRTWAIGAGVSEARALTIPNLIDLERLRQSTAADLRSLVQAEPDQLVGILVASFKREKGIDHLVECVARSRERARLKIAVVGGGEQSEFANECRAALRRHRLETTISFLGRRDDVPSLLRGADFALLSSHSESGPLVLIEYLAVALPIVSTLAGDIAHRLATSVPGFVPPRDADAFARELDALASLSVEKRQARGDVGRRALEVGWDIRSAMPRWYEVYRAAIAH